MIQRKLPNALRRYRAGLTDDVRSLAYFRLNAFNCVDVSGGDLKQLGLTFVDSIRPICEYLNTLVGLLPTGDEPVVIRNATNTNGLFYNLHLFTDLGQQWVVIVDNTEAALKLQIEQQVRLSNDIMEEQGRASHNSSM